MTHLRFSFHQPTRNREENSSHSPRTLRCLERWVSVQSNQSRFSFRLGRRVSSSLRVSTLPPASSFLLSLRSPLPSISTYPGHHGSNGRSSYGSWSSRSYRFSIRREWIRFVYSLSLALPFAPRSVPLTHWILHIMIFRENRHRRNMLLRFVDSSSPFFFRLVETRLV